MPLLDPVDAALAAALGVPDPDAGQDELVTIDQLAQDAEVPVAVLEAIEREGLLVARDGAVEAGDARFAASDAPTVRAAMAMLQTGLPLAEFLDLARRADRQLRELADEAVETFLLYVRDPVRGTQGTSPEAAESLVDAFQRMLPATRDLVGGHFQALVVAAARERLAAVVDHADIDPAVVDHADADGIDGGQGDDAVAGPHDDLR